MAGAKGATGKDNATSRRTRKKNVSDVMRHIDRIDRQLDIQLTRMSQIQVEVDELRAKILRM
ncbi:MAG TPA: hypothetical protein VGZ27_14565 [Vicinamibacterales bacterium]|nr:hypothetical protein [Vicinamibacterales bacterium]